MNMNLLNKNALYFSVCILITIHGTAPCMNRSTIDRHVPVKNPIKKNDITLDEFIKCASVFREETTYDRFGDFAIVAATEILDITGQAPEKLKVMSYADIFNKNSCNFLQYFDATNNPQIGSLALYLDKSEKLQHAAVVTQITPGKPELCMVKGKVINQSEISEYKLLSTPNKYHGNIYFYNLKSEFQDKNKLLTDMQQNINRSNDIKILLLEAQKTLISLANGNNPSFPILPLFDQKETVYKKAHYLLKTAVGLDINACDESGKTASMLAAQRNDFLFLIIFLNMNADVNKQDIDGNTALHLAVQNNAKYALNKLLMNNNIDKTIKNKKELTARDIAVNIKNENELTDRNIIKNKQIDLIIGMIDMEITEPSPDLAQCFQQ
jgi:hypothetical protein